MTMSGDALRASRLVARLDQTIAAFSDFPITALTM